MSLKFTSLLILLPLLSIAQEEKSWTLDQFLEVTDKKKFVYTRKTRKEANLIAYTDYTKKGEIIQKGYFKDETFSIHEGHFSFYWAGAKLYEGDYLDGAPTGMWYFYERNKLSDSLEYPDKKE